jgi:hypothetical protein
MPGASKLVGLAAPLARGTDRGTARITAGRIAWTRVVGRSVCVERGVAPASSLASMTRGPTEPFDGSIRGQGVVGLIPEDAVASPRPCNRSRNGEPPDDRPSPRGCRSMVRHHDSVPHAGPWHQPARSHTANSTVRRRNRRVVGSSEAADTAGMRPSIARPAPRVGSSVAYVPQCASSAPRSIADPICVRAPIPLDFMDGSMLTGIWA